MITEANYGLQAPYQQVKGVFLRKFLTDTRS
jgi:hypothetical protein